jgi:hypothetical protein
VPFDPSSVVSRNPGAVSERLGVETVVLEPDQDLYVRLNATGTRVWEALAEPASAAGLAEALAVEFGLAGDRALADVEAFVDALSRRGLVTVSRPAPQSGA